jgi:hypothetical protein
MRPVQPRIVPMGPHISNIHDPRHIVSNSARRLEVTFEAAHSSFSFLCFVIYESLLHRSAEVFDVASPVETCDNQTWFILVIILIKHFINC